MSWALTPRCPRSWLTSFASEMAIAVHIRLDKKDFETLVSGGVVNFEVPPDKYDLPSDLDVVDQYEVELILADIGFGVMQRAVQSAIAAQQEKKPT